MKFDCPNCGEDLKSRKIDVNDFARGSKGFACPKCAERIKAKLLPEELAAVLLIVLSLWSVQFFPDVVRAVPLWVSVSAYVAEIAVVFAVLKYVVRGKQRYGR